jgi:hypothetical protein
MAWTPILTTEDAILRSAVDPDGDLYYAGSNYGRVYARPGGANWKNVFSRPGGWHVTDIEVDPHDASFVYVSFGPSSGPRIYRLQRFSAAPTAMAAADITANLDPGLVVQTLAVDRLAPFTIYAGLDQAGVYRGRSTDGGATWSWTPYNNGLPNGLDVRDLEIHPATGVMRAGTFGRSAYEMRLEFPVGSLLATEGRVAALRVQDVGTGFGIPSDRLDAEVIIQLDTQPGRAFGFQLRKDTNEAAHRGMLDLLRDAFRRERVVRLAYFRTGLHNGRIVRVFENP